MTPYVVNTGSGNGLSPIKPSPEAILIDICTLENNIRGIFFIKGKVFSFNKMRLKMPSGKFRPFCLGLKRRRKCLAADGQYWSACITNLAFKHICRFTFVDNLPTPYVCIC